MRSVRTFALALLLVLSSAVVAPASASQTDIAIDDVSVSTEQPVTGETMTVTVDVANRETSDGAVDVKEVFIRERGSLSNSDIYAQVDDIHRIGAVAPGGTLEVPLELTLDEAGEYEFTVYATVEDNDGNERRTSYPLSVTVEEPVVDWDVSVQSASTSEMTNGSDRLITDFSNFGTTELENVEVRASQNGEVVE